MGPNGGKDDEIQMLQEAGFNTQGAGSGSYTFVDAARDTDSDTKSSTQAWHVADDDARACGEIPDNKPSGYESQAGSRAGNEPINPDPNLVGNRG